MLRRLISALAALAFGLAVLAAPPLDSAPDSGPPSNLSETATPADLADADLVHHALAPHPGFVAHRWRNSQSIYLGTTGSRVRLVQAWLNRFGWHTRSPSGCDRSFETRVNGTWSHCDRHAFYAMTQLRLSQHLWSDVVNRSEHWNMVQDGSLSVSPWDAGSTCRGTGSYSSRWTVYCTWNSHPQSPRNYTLRTYFNQINNTWYFWHGDRNRWYGV